jgi:hypothetical protein
MNRSSSILWCGIAGAGTIAAAGCGAASEAAPDTQDPPAKVAQQEACPLALPGATSSTEDTVDGVVVAFSTPRAGERPELARRVQRLATLHDSMRGGPPEDLSAAPPQAPGPTAEGAGDASAKGASGARSGGALDSKAAAESTEEGARLVVRPRDPARLDSMRDHLRKQAEELVQRVCDQAGRKSLH